MGGRSSKRPSKSKDKYDAKKDQPGDQSKYASEDSDHVNPETANEASKTAVENGTEKPIQERADDTCVKPDGPTGHNPVNQNPVVPADQNLPDPADQNLLDPADQNLLDPADQNLPDPADQNLPDPADQNLFDPTDQNLSDPADQNLSDPADQNLFDPADQNLSDPTDQNLSDPTNQNLPDPADQNLSDPADQNLSNPADQNLFDPADQNLSDPTDQNLSDSADQNLSDPADYNLSDPADQNLSDPANQNLSDPADYNLADPDDHNSSNDPLDDPAMQIVDVGQPANPIQPIHHEVHECMKKTIKYRDVKVKVQLQVCNNLDVQHTLGGDYRSLGGELDFNMQQIRIFESKPQGDPTRQILEAWDKKDGNTLFKLMNAIRKLERGDIMELLEPEMERLSRECNCENCGGIN